MLTLSELRFRNIGRFVDEQVIDFSSLGAFVQIDGLNQNTGGSSGSGKSTIFQALDYLFGFNARPATVLQSRKLINPEEKVIWVQGTFELNDDIIVIIRSKSSIKITIGGETYEKSRAEEKIDTLLGMPRDLFRKIMHKWQDEGGFFLNLSPSEMNGFLMDCINLSSFKSKIAIIDARLNVLESYILTEKQTLEKDKAGLSATQDAVLALGLAPIQDIHQEVIDELKAKADRSTARFVEVGARCEALVQEYLKNRPDSPNSGYDANIREDLERRRKEIEGKISACLETERQRQEEVRGNVNQKNLARVSIVSRIDKGTRAKEDATKIAAEIKSIQASICPTCEQKWETQNSIDKVNTKLADLMRLKPLLDDQAKAEAELVELDIEIARLQSLAGPIYDHHLPDWNEELRDVVEQILQEKKKAQELYDQQSADMKKRLDDFLAGRQELEARLNVEINQARGQADVDKRVLDLAAQKLQNYKEAKATYDRSFDKLKRQEEIFSKQVLSCETNLKDALDEQILALETKKALKYYVSCSFDEALEEISDRATKIIRCIPNTGNATIRLEGTKETKDGRQKEEINAVISMDGEDGVPLKSFSGGERSSADLAVDLAVIDYIESKTGKGLNIFILDEPFKGLGTVEIEMALEVLKNSNINKKLIIVDHNPEVKQMVQNRLLVIREGLTSKVAA